MKTIPKNIKMLLWNIDLDELDLKKHSFFIIERVMKYGDEKDVQWMLKMFNKEQLIEVVKRSKNVDKKSANYWALRFGIDRSEIACLSNTFQKIH